MELLDKIVDLRYTVGFLGESGNYHWWDTGFLNPTGLQFLSIVFPRTAQAAGFTGVVAAARRLHDERIGVRGGTYHLFRLPISVEQDLHKQLLSADLKKSLPRYTSKGDALEALGRFGSAPAGSFEGPVQIEAAKRLSSMLDEMAIRYSAAFQTEKMGFPYYRSDPS